MSDYHVIDVARLKNKATVAFHFAVPAETNVATKNLSTCVVERLTRDGTPVTQVPNHVTDFASENAELVAGTKVEVVETLEFDANESNANKLAVIETRYSTLSTLVPDWIRNEFKFWGYNGDVS